MPRVDGDLASDSPAERPGGSAPAEHRQLGDALGVSAGDPEGCEGEGCQGKGTDVHDRRLRCG